MILRAIPIDLIKNSSGDSVPKDVELHRMAVLFGEKELSIPPNFSEYNKVWAICEIVDEKVVSVQGLLGYAMTPDFTLNKFLSPDAIICGYERADQYLADMGGRGMETLISMDPEEEEKWKCPQGLRTLLKLGARPANRFWIKVR